MFLNRKYRILKKMNYFADQQGIFERYINEMEGWSAHLENTKKAILNSAFNKPKGNCAILGSGWLLDIPIDELSVSFQKVYLFDIVHPSQVKHKLLKYPNVTAVELDITGGAIQEVYQAIQMYKSYKNKRNILEFQINGFEYPIDFDFIASVNILSQLDQMLLSYIRKYNIYSEDELLELRQIIQQKHIESLPKEKTCLITDFEENVLNNNNEVERKNNILQISLPESLNSNWWDWHFDNTNYYPGKKVIFKVVALDL